MNYRAFSVGLDGHFIASDIITAENDAAAILLAADHVNKDVGIELWHLSRQVAVLPRVMATE